MAKAEDFAYIVDKFPGEQAAQNTLYTLAFLSASVHIGRFSETAILNAI